MKKETSSNFQLQRAGLYMAGLIFAWTAAVATSFFLNLNQHRQAFFAEMHIQAKTIHIWKWVFVTG